MILDASSAAWIVLIVTLVTIAPDFAHSIYARSSTNATWSIRTVVHKPGTRASIRVGFFNVLDNQIESRAFAHFQLKSELAKQKIVHPLLVFI
jgi:hypothetical protein